MESIGDKARAYLLAMLVHLLVAGLLLTSLLWTETARPISLPGPVIEAELVGISAAPKAHAVSKPKPPLPKPPDPTPEPPKPPQPEAPAEQRNDQVDREKVAEMATQKAEQAQRAEDERKRQQQVLLEQQERDRQKLLEQTKRDHAEAEKKLKLEKEKLAQLEDVQKHPKPAPAAQVPEAVEAKTGTNGQDDSLQAQYFAAIQNAVKTNWLRPDTAQPGLKCMLRIVQIPGGDVIGVEVASPCNADPMTRDSIEQAVKRAAPLPYKGYESEFRRQFNFNFIFDG
jgi:colicin import membrane protein